MACRLHIASRMKHAIGLFCVGIMACSGVARGADTRDLDTVTLAEPTIAGRGVGESCGWDPCRADLVCDERHWTCALPK